MISEWNTRWINSSEYKHTKFFYPEVETHRAKHLLKHSRSTVQLLTRAITGHNFLAKHQNRIGEAVAPECRLCEEDFETFKHLITTCPRLRLSRLEYLGTDNLEHDDGWKIRDILKFIQSTCLYEMLTVKDHYEELLIVDIEHNYSSDNSSQ